jgi:hypothetical protein
MDKEVAPAFELEDQILSAPTQGLHSLAFEKLGNGRRRLGPREPVIEDLHTLEASPCHAWSQSRPDRLNLG